MYKHAVWTQGPTEEQYAPSCNNYVVVCFYESKGNNGATRVYRRVYTFRTAKQAERKAASFVADRYAPSRRAVVCGGRARGDVELVAEWNNDEPVQGALIRRYPRG